MVDVEARTRKEAQEDSAVITRAAEPVPQITSRRRLRLSPLLITLVALAVAGALGRAMWDAYMGAPWTRDGTVRVYVAPISVMMVAAWFVTIWLRWSAARFGLLRYVWHPSLFVFAVYMIVLSSMVVAVAGR